MLNLDNISPGSQIEKKEIEKAVFELEGKVSKLENKATNGQAITADDFIYDEIPVGLINGVNASFISLFDFIPETVEVFLNGIKQIRVTDFNTSGSRYISLSFSPNINETISINYLKA